MEWGCYDWLYEQSVTKFLLAAWKSGLMVVLAVGLDGGVQKYVGLKLLD